MDKPVLTIFKILIGTYVMIFVGCMFIELCNMTLYSTYINTYLKTSLRKSCEYFSEETYKSDFSSGDIKSLKNHDGGTAISSNFYNGYNDKETIYQYLYNDGANIKNWVNSGINKADGARHTKKLNEIINNINYLIQDDYLGQFYRESLMTPLNLGVPYIGDEDGSGTSAETLEHISHWILCSLLSNGNSNNVYNTNSNTYVLYNGFRVYVGQLDITGLDYRLYNLRNNDERLGFQRATNMEGVNIADKDTTDALASDYAITVGVNYTVPIEYEGITPFKRVFSWILTGSYNLTNRNAEGTYDTGSNANYGLSNFRGTDRSSHWASSINFNAVTDFSGGGYDNIDINGHLPHISSKVVYYLVH